MDIPAINRKLAEVTHMSLDRNGSIAIGPGELKLILSLLRRNMELVQRLDELKNLSQVAYELGDTEWLQEICRQIEELEAQFT